MNNNDHQTEIFDPKIWIRKCFICDNPPDQKAKQWHLCIRCENRYNKEEYFKRVVSLEDCFVTILPEMTEDKMTEITTGCFSDLFVKDMLKPNSNQHHPFSENIGGLHDFGLSCGQPVFQDLESLKFFSRFNTITCLDLSQYYWTGTLKDIRSWGILSLAIKKNIKYLALWTAGNAGLSLARMVHRWNALNKDKSKHIRVVCLLGTDTPSEIIVNLRAHDCRVAPIATGTGMVMFKDQIRSIVNSLYKADEPHKDYWHVTDGWEGIGLFMYRLLCRHAIKINNPDFIVVPVGTGNLLTGFYQGVQDMNKKGTEKCKLVGALPYEDNVLNPFDTTEDNISPASKVVKRVPPIAPKLTGFYSPLSPCLWHMTQNKQFNDPGAVEFIEVDKAQQIEVGAQILSPVSGISIASEPSALIAFGALKTLSQRLIDHGGNPKEKNVLVVNSGLGLMSNKDEELYTDSIFRFR